MDIRSKLLKIHQEYGDEGPNPQQVQAFFASLNTSDQIALAALIVSLWSYLFPRAKDNKFRCKYKSPLTGKKCGAMLVSIEYEKSKRELIMICEKGHKTTKRAG